VFVPDKVKVLVPDLVKLPAPDITPPKLVGPFTTVVNVLPLAIQLNQSQL
jgi:hypothetical protein